MHFYGGNTPNYRNLMVYIDGTNFLLELGKHIGAKMDPHRPPLAAFKLARVLCLRIQTRASGNIMVRRHWFGSYCGSGEEEQRQLNALHENGFQARLIHKPAQGPEKGVDMALAIQMMTDAFNRNFDTGWIVAGDADYAELVRETKRYGAVVNGVFLQGPLSDALRLSCDEFHDMNLLFDDNDSKAYIKEIQADVAAHPPARRGTPTVAP